MKQRTLSQNAALHVFFKLVADALNDGGFSVQETIKHTLDVDWTPDLVKVLIWKKAQRKFLGKDSTTQLEKHMEIDQIYDHVNRFLAKLEKDGEPCGIHVPFPTDPGKISNYPTYQ